MHFIDRVGGVAVGAGIGDCAVAVSILVEVWFGVECVVAVVVGGIAVLE